MATTRKATNAVDLERAQNHSIDDYAGSSKHMGSATSAILIETLMDQQYQLDKSAINPREVVSLSRVSCSEPSDDTSNQSLSWPSIDRNGDTKRAGWNTRYSAGNDEKSKSHAAMREGCSSTHESSYQQTSRWTGNKKSNKPTPSEKRRLRRNNKEKERSNRISMQFLELRKLLSGSGIVIPKGTKGCLMQTTMTYIQTLQENQTQTEK